MLGPVRTDLGHGVSEEFVVIGWRHAPSLLGLLDIRQNSQSSQAEVPTERLLDHLIGRNPVARRRTTDSTEQPFVDLDGKLTASHGKSVRPFSPCRGLRREPRHAASQKADAACRVRCGEPVDRLR